MVVDGGGAGLAIGLDLQVARVVRTAVDKPLADAVHLGVAHVGQARQHLERLGRDRHRVIRDKVAFAALLQHVQDHRGAHLEMRAPDILDRLGRDRGEDRAPLGHMRITVLAHHVLAHQQRHQPVGLHRGEHIDALFLLEDVVSPGDQRRAKLRHIGDGRGLAHAFEVRIGIGPESFRVNFIDRRVGHSSPD